MLQQLRSLSAEQALAVGFGGSAVLLLGAHLFEAAGYAPCDLCLDQREAHWAALSVGAAGLAAAFALNSRIGAITSLCVAALIYMFSAGLAGYHAGVEYGFWPGPATCSGVAGETTSLSGMLNALSQPTAAPACDEAAWTLLGVSMAGYNMLASLALGALALVAGRNAILHQRRSRLA